MERTCPKGISHSSVLLPLSTFSIFLLSFYSRMPSLLYFLLALPLCCFASNPFGPFGLGHGLPSLSPSLWMNEWMFRPKSIICGPLSIPPQLYIFYILSADWLLWPKGLLPHFVVPLNPPMAMGYMAQLPLAAHSRLERRPPRWSSLEHLWPPAYGHSPIPSFLSPIPPFPILFHTALPNRPIPGSIPPPFPSVLLLPFFFLAPDGHGRLIPFPSSFFIPFTHQPPKNHPPKGPPPKAPPTTSTINRQHSPTKTLAFSPSSTLHHQNRLIIFPLPFPTSK